LPDIERLKGSLETLVFGDDRRYAAWLHELDAWTEYWDIYHPETKGHFYFGNGSDEQGLLTKFLPREQRPPVFVAWTQMALSTATAKDFWRELATPEVSAAVMEVDAFVTRIFRKYFGDAADTAVHADYLEAIFRCATDSLPPATERDLRIASEDWRKPTAGRHMIDNDFMWFAWAFHLEASRAIAGKDGEHPRRALQLAGVATGAAANFAWRGHRRTRVEYQRDERTSALLRARGLRWALDFDQGAAEVHALFRIREWGHE
jgi:hypothetical protein